MNYCRVIVILPILAVLQSCLASGPTRNELIQLRVQPIVKGELLDCETTLGPRTSKWNQCASQKPIKFDGSTYYTGSWIDGKPNGKGSMVYADGYTYEGEVKEGYRHGKGKYIYPNGTIYEGDFVIGKGEGIGMFKYKIEGSYEGSIKNWRVIGQGVRTLADGIVVEGWFDNFKAGYGEASVTFKNGDVWTGSHRYLWNVGSSTKGKLQTKDGELVEANIKTIGVRSCSSKPGTCGRSFEIQVVGLTGCNKYAPKTAEYSKGGLPLQVGPIFLGMSFKNFQCVLDKKFKDITYESGIAQGVSLWFGTPVTFLSPLEGDNVRFAKASLYNTSVEVSNLFSMPDWMRKTTKTGKAPGGQIEVLFWNDKLATIKLGQPSAPNDYLIKKYGPPKRVTQKHNEKCIRGNKVVSSIQHYKFKQSWRDSQIVMIYDKGTGLEGGELESDSAIFGKAKLPSCSAKLYDKNVYQLVDLKLTSEYASVRNKQKTKEKQEERKVYKGF